MSFRSVFGHLNQLFLGSNPKPHCLLEGCRVRPCFSLDGMFPEHVLGQSFRSGVLEWACRYWAAISAVRVLTHIFHVELDVREDDLGFCCDVLGTEVAPVYLHHSRLIWAGIHVCLFVCHL